MAVFFKKINKTLSKTKERFNPCSNLIVYQLMHIFCLIFMFFESWDSTPPNWITLRMLILFKNRKNVFGMDVWSDSLHLSSRIREIFWGFIIAYCKTGGKFQTRYSTIINLPENKENYSFLFRIIALKRKNI